MPLRIALFGQAAFGRDVLTRLIEGGHTVVGVYAPPAGSRPDPLAEEAESRGLPLFRHKRFRRRVTPPSGPAYEARPERVEEHAKLGADLNVLAYVTAILPGEIVFGPPRKSLCFHPSLLPRFRGGSAIAWQIIEGEAESGVTVFQPDEGVDTGPIVVRKGGVAILADHSAASLYYDRLYPLGVEAMVEAVNAVADGTARFEPQDESRATFQGLVDDDVARIDWARDAASLDRRIRGCDPAPGAWAMRGNDRVRLFDGRVGDAAGGESPGTVLGLEDGRLWIAARGGRIGAGKIRLGEGAKAPAAEVELAPGDALA